MKFIKTKNILAFIIVGTFVVFNTKIVFFDDTSLSLHSITKAFAQGESGSDSKEEQDWIVEDSNCFEYTCIMGIEYEEVCDCSYEIGICPLGDVDDCFDDGGTSQVGGPDNCTMNGQTGYSCTEW